MSKIMYVCEECEENNPEYCGRCDPAELRLAPDGRQVCQECFDDNMNPVWKPAAVEDDAERLRWVELPPITLYAPQAA